VVREPGPSRALVALVMTGWRTSSCSSHNGQCVEVCARDGKAAVRDSKDRTGPVLVFSPPAWDRFTAGVKAAQARA
jgi:hypothetical protein